MIFMAVLAVILFFGGWHSPFEGIAYLEAGVSWVPGIIWLLAKSTFFMFLYLWIWKLHRNFFVNQFFSSDSHTATQLTKTKIFN
jgi:NADH:ubiquinone oxidoreductase subunit H